MVAFNYEQIEAELDDAKNRIAVLTEEMASLRKEIPEDGYASLRKEVAEFEDTFARLVDVVDGIIDVVGKSVDFFGRVGQNELALCILIAFVRKRDFVDSTGGVFRLPKLSDAPNPGEKIQQWSHDVHEALRAMAHDEKDFEEGSIADLLRGPRGMRDDAE